jgi:ADP-L-glycero-D-manno-heptose 6-epimerase
MNRILLTGSSGFIGRNLYNKLSENTNNKIYCIEEMYFTFPDWTAELKNILDTFNPIVVYHVGACSDTLESDVNYMFTRNYESTKIISEWCKVNDSKMIYSSSAANYGVSGKYPSNLYGWSKYAAEDIVTKNDGISLRYFNVYGPGEEDKKKMSSVAYQMYQKNKKGYDIQLFPGKPTRDFIFVDDVVDANIFAYKNYDTLEKKYYEVGSGESRSFEDVLDILKIPYTYAREDMIPHGYQFYTKSNPNLYMNSWKPKFNLESGLIEYKKYLDKKCGEN